MAARVSKDNFEAEVLQASIPVLVEFYSDSCIPCKQMSPILGDIEDDYEDRLKVVKVNANFDGNWQNSIPLWFLRPSCFSKMERKQSVCAV